MRRAGLLLLAGFVFGVVPVRAAEPELVNIRSVDPTIIVELRYAGVRNIVQRALYPQNMPGLVRPSVAQKLAVAQNYLRERDSGMKIWDAYRPKSAHDQLWQYSRNNDYVADPADGRGSLHTWGVAIDATLVDKDGAEMEMPTDFDSFTPAAMLYYKGSNDTVRRNLHRLQSAMAVAGFYGLRTEWWHFVAKDWQKYRAIPEVIVAPQSVVNGRVAPAGMGTESRSRATVAPAKPNTGSTAASGSSMGR
jgi:D-alanyl-D-alanine dipeptidase